MKTKKKSAGHNPPPVAISALVQEAERCIAAAIPHFGLTVPAERILVTVQSRGRKRALGWFAPERWQRKDNSTAVHEINLAAEHLHEHNMGETLIHELAHAENRHNNIRDCNANQYHNKHFKVMAERLGLIVGEKDPKYGFGFTQPGPPVVAFLEEIGFNHKLFQLARLDLMRRAGGARTSLIKAVCGDCGYTCRITRMWLDMGNPTCPCGGEISEE